MSLTKDNELKVQNLFRTKRNYIKESEEYLDIRNNIAKFLLAALRSDIQSCIHFWHSRYNIDMSEGESLVYENLLQAIDCYQVDRGKCKFSSFFWTVNSCLFKNYLTRIYAQKRAPQVTVDGKRDLQPIYSMSQEIFQDNDNVTLEDTIQDRFCLEDYLHNKLLLEKIYKQVSPKHKRVLKRLFFGRTYNEIGKVLDMTPSDICSLLGRLRKRFKGWDI